MILSLHSTAYAGNDISNIQNKMRNHDEWENNAWKLKQILKMQKKGLNNKNIQEVFDLLVTSCFSWNWRPN